MMKRWRFPLFGVLLALITGGGVFHLTAARQEQALKLSASQRSALIAETLRVAIERFRAVPDLAAHAGEITGLLEAPGEAALRLANGFLESVARETALSALYVLNAKGLALAASNWREPTSFIGHDYAFRPYFTETIEKGSGRYFGVGVTTGVPGYFLASAIRKAGDTLGVVVAKIDFAPLEASWASAGEQVAVLDADGVVFLTSHPAWRYRPLRALSPARIAAVEGERRYADVKLGPPILVEDAEAGLVLAEPVPGTPWTLVLLASDDLARRQAFDAAAMATLGVMVLLLLGLISRMHVARLRTDRAARQMLEARVVERTGALRVALEQVEAEVAERARIDAELHKTRDGLVQAAKLAAMGQAFAGLAHEVNQPLTALRTYLASTRALMEQGDAARASGNIVVMAGAVDRLAGLTDDLKRLARRSDDRREIVDLSAVAGEILRLLKFRLHDSGVTATLDAPDPVPVLAVPGRLEQVVMTLLLNAIDAVREAPERLIRVEVGMREGRADLVVIDAGPGVEGGQVGRLFEPFFTTKDVGQGLGLGLAIAYSILADHGGTLAYERLEGQTCFRAGLPLAAGETA